MGVVVFLLPGRIEFARFTHAIYAFTDSRPNLAACEFIDWQAQYVLYLATLTTVAMNAAITTGISGCEAISPVV